MNHSIVRARQETLEARPRLGLVETDAFDRARHQDGEPLLSSIYALVLCSRLVLKVRQSEAHRDLVLHLVVGIDCSGTKRVLGLGSTPALVAGLCERGLEHALIVVSDSDLMANAFRDAGLSLTTLESIHTLVRQTLFQVPSRQRAGLSSALRAVYSARDLESAKAALALFAAGRWGRMYPGIAPFWQMSLPRLEPLFDLPRGVRHFLATADAAETFFEKLRRRAIAVPTHFASEDAALAHFELLSRKCSGD